MSQKKEVICVKTDRKEPVVFTLTEGNVTIFLLPQTIDTWNVFGEVIYTDITIAFIPVVCINK